MKKITSFTVDHNKIIPGIYISRIDGDITTYDIRTRKPNCGDFMDNETMHTVEHLFATFVRNSEFKKEQLQGCTERSFQEKLEISRKYFMQRWAQ